MGPVEVTGKGVRLRGEKVEAKLSTRVVTFKGATEMVFYPRQLTASPAPTRAPLN